jgi:predicted 3-demethylubiquinone-9 3-methyltransferase (glyoxalase superfamily)
MAIQAITPFLWFDSNAEEAANHYVSVFGNSCITQISRCGEAGRELQELFREPK